MGGVVAFEMAQQLQAQDQEIALLALLDSHAPNPRDSADELSEAALLAEFVGNFGLSLNDFGMTSDELARLAPDEQLACVLERARKAHLVPADIELPGAQLLFDTFATNLRVLRAYRPTVYSGTITLLVAGDAIVENAENDPAAGWQALAAGGVDTYYVPGNHYTIMREPHVSVLAERLNATIRHTRKERLS